MVCTLLVVDVEMGRDRVGIFSNRCVWVIDGSGAVGDALWNFVF